MSNDNPGSMQSYDWSDLRALWRSIDSGDASAVRPGRALEMLVLRAFELDGADAREPYVVKYEGHPVEQIDGAVYAAGLACLIECKSQRAAINVEPIAKLRNQLMRRPAGVLGMLFSTAPYSRAAVALTTFTAPHLILLWWSAEIDLFLARENPCAMLKEKYRRCVEEATPDFNLAIKRP